VRSEHTRRVSGGTNSHVLTPYACSLSYATDTVCFEGRRKRYYPLGNVGIDAARIRRVVGILQ